MRQIAIIILLVIMGIPGFTRLKALDKVYIEKHLTPMEALDLVKEAYADNFTKISQEENTKYYFYKLDMADFYLVYEDTDETSGHYLLHLYEFVLDDKDSEIGHTVTYGWYWVNPYTSDISKYP